MPTCEIEVVAEGERVSFHWRPPDCKGESFTSCVDAAEVRAWVHQSQEIGSAIANREDRGEPGLRDLGSSLPGRTCNPMSQELSDQLNRLGEKVYKGCFGIADAGQRCKLIGKLRAEPACSVSTTSPEYG